MSKKYGLTTSKWKETKAEIRSILIDLAKNRQTITYGDLTAQLTTATLHPYSYAFGALLRQVCEEEELAGRGLMCALVVRKSSGIPGNGYFKYADTCGRDISNPKKCWQDEIERLYEIWEWVESTS